MTLIPSLGSAAVQILQQSQIASPLVEENASADNDLVATANGVKSEEVEPTKDFWDINRVDPTQMKVKLFERLAEKFGFNLEDFDSFSEFGQAVRYQMEMMKTEDPKAAMLMFHEIEKDLGLDKLGISLEELVEAAIDPGGKEAEKLDAALGELAEELNTETDEEKVFGSLRVDGNGIYSLPG